MNRPVPDNCITDDDMEPDPIIGDRSTSYITKAEIRSSKRKLKNGKASGVDGITVELLKADTLTTVDWLESLSKVIMGL